MFWKLAFIAVLAVGVFGEYQVTDEQKAQLDTAITEACKKTNAEAQAPQVQTAIHAFGDCVKGLFNYTVIKDEIEEAKPKGDLDEVCKKYCEKSAQLKTCINSVLTGVTPCVPTEYRQHVPTANTAAAQLIDFVCHKEGDRIALFIAEKGPECFISQQEALKTCGEQIKNSVTSVEEAKALSKEAKCQKYDDLTRCVVTALEKCENPTPANMAEALLKFVKKATPCGKQ